MVSRFGAEVMGSPVSTSVFESHHMCFQGLSWCPTSHLPWTWLWPACRTRPRSCAQLPQCFFWFVVHAERGLGNFRLQYLAL